MATGTLLAVLLLSLLDLRLHNVARYFNAHKNQELALYRSSPSSNEETQWLEPLRNKINSGPIPERIELFGLSHLTNGINVFDVGNISGYNPMLYNRYVRMFGAASFSPSRRHNVHSQTGPRIFPPAPSICSVYARL